MAAPPKKSTISAADPEPAAPRSAADGHDVYRLLLDVDDRPGIVHDVSSFLRAAGANILELDSHAVDGVFYMRVEFASPSGTFTVEELRARFGADVGGPLGMSWAMSDVTQPKRVCLLVSRDGHCLLDLLTRWHGDELPCDIELVVSNHADLAGEVERFGVEFCHIPVHQGRKREAEELLLQKLGGAFDLLVMARYMQILSGDFLSRVGAPVINIHHSFLPAFAGADPYARARERGVKLIGATAHYATEELDAGPIIEQDVQRVSHRHSESELTRVGRDIERTVLARAVRWHLEDRVAVHGNRTVIFA
jgi:formyltetrahydrofolate deformylase